MLNQTDIDATIASLEHRLALGPKGEAARDLLADCGAASLQLQQAGYSAYSDARGRVLEVIYRTDQLSHWSTGLGWR